MDTKIKKVGVLPLVKYYMEQLGLVHLFDKYVPNRNGAEIPPFQVLSMMVANIIISPKPLYRVGDWLHDYLDGIAEKRFEAAKYNDDRLGRSLDLLFEADRASFMSELSGQAIRVHQLEIGEIHNDTTSITFLGAYEAADPKAVKIMHGHNKDHRPDCKQIVFGLNITADGHVPLSYRLYDGNQADVATHQPNWDHLRELLGKEDFIYVADCKLCSAENLSKIAENGGRFISVIPRNFSEVKGFLQRVRDGEAITWQHEHVVPDSRKKGRYQTYRIHVGEQMNGYRVLWVHSDAKARLEQKARENRIAKAEQALQDIAAGLNRYRLKTRAQIEAAIKKATHGVGPYISVRIHEEHEEKRVKIGKGRPGPNSRYRKETITRYRLAWCRNEGEIEATKRTDGLFPLVDNTTLEPVDVLRTYKDQPYLEKRFSTHKSVLEVAPVFLKTPQRIEAMMFLYFIALMIVSLIERRIRREMQDQEIVSLPLRPDRSHTKRPTWRTIRDTLDGIHLSTIEDAGKVIQERLKGLNKLCREVLRLLKIPIEVYTALRDQWWVFTT